MEAGTYNFECNTMPWTDAALGVYGKDEILIVVSVKLSEEEIQSLVKMMQWAWDNSWFEKSTSDTVCSELLKLQMPELYDKVWRLAHQQFCQKYPNCEGVNGFGEYEIFIPDEIIHYAAKLQSQNDATGKENNFLRYSKYVAMEQLHPGERITVGNQYGTILNVQKNNVVTIHIDEWWDCFDEEG